MRYFIKTFLQFTGFYISAFLILMSCINEQKILVKTDFCAKIQRNDTMTLTHELESVAEQMTIQTGVFVLED
jgi:putative cardiolipin synthase